MIFEEIIITNLFTYYDRQLFDLRGIVRDSNIVLISGRNGYGKTNFLNSIKLLFGGITESLRKSVQRGRVPSQKQYVLGAGDDWIGILNKKARSKGKNTCSVEATWTEDLGRVKLIRRWIVWDNDFDWEIFLEADFLSTILTRENEGEIRRFLDERLPESYIPYFFFDGEQIREIAEANWHSQQQHMERLLNISPVEILIEYLGKTASDLKRKALDKEEEARLVALESQLKEFNAQRTAKEQAIDDLSSEIEELEGKLEYLQRTIEGMKAFRNQADEVRLKQEKQDLEKQLSALQEKICEILPRDIPIYGNSQLSEKCINKLKQIIESESATQSELLNKMAKTLPVYVFDMPPYPTERLSKSQVDFYKERLKKVILSFESRPEHWTDNVIKIDASKSKEILEVLTLHGNLKSFKSERAQEFRKLRDLKSRHKDINEQLENISILSADEKQLYEERVANAKEIEVDLTDKKAEVKSMISQLKSICTTIDNKRREIEAQQDIYIKSVQERKKVEKVNKIKDFFNAYRLELKKLRREEIEKAINHHFPQLMTSQNMIKRIEVGDDFDLRYLDENENTIGMGSLSTGTKQLVATSLLWALKDVSKKRIPMIIDTPLSRIDHEHQKNLLSYYYPKAGEQVIILPTDSELDEAKYKLLKPHIYKEYKLLNLTGFKTEVIQSEMYPEA